MQFVEVLESAMTEINTSFDEQLSLIDKFMEMASSELQQKVESAELQYLSESESESATDTLNHLYQEAEETFSSKAKKAIEKIEEMFKQFISNMRTTIQKFLLQSSVDGKIAKLQKKIMLNPFLRTKSISYECDDAAMELFPEIYPIAIRGIAKLNAGSDCGAELEAITSKISDWEDHKKKTTNKYKVADLLNVFQVFVKDALKTLDYVDESGKKILKECKKHDSSNALSLGRSAVRVAKITMNGMIDGINAIMSGLSQLSKTSMAQVAGEDASSDIDRAGKQLKREEQIKQDRERTKKSQQAAKNLEDKRDAERWRRHQKQTQYKKESAEDHLSFAALAEDLFSEFVQYNNANDVSDNECVEFSFDSMFESFMESSSVYTNENSGDSGNENTTSSISDFAKDLGFAL